MTSLLTLYRISSHINVIADMFVDIIK